MFFIIFSVSFMNMSVIYIMVLVIPSSVDYSRLDQLECSTFDQAVSGGQYFDQFSIRTCRTNVLLEKVLSLFSNSIRTSNQT